MLRQLILSSLFLFLLTDKTPISAKKHSLHYYKMAVEAIDLDIREVNRNAWSHAEKIVYYSERFLNAPYRLQCEGEGEHGRYEREPLMNLKEINCMTYCEIVLALTLADYYENLFNILQHIRYRQGIIGMATRNHYTMADWLPANAWCLDDVTQLVGADDIQPLTRTISHTTFFDGKGIHDLPQILPDREITIQYLPLSKLAAHEAQLMPGDIVSLIQDRPGIFSAHMLMLVKRDGQTYFRHASMAAHKVVDVPFITYIADLAKNSRYLGMCFMRVKEQIEWQTGNYTHGKFFLPAPVPK
ncbi:DUF1460 domain-containing protein [candidate division KSB1 bacterium]|nr:DUF1460 domain-containing protein [candidate division KSB1 bacterium]